MRIDFRAFPLLVAAAAWACAPAADAPADPGALPLLGNVPYSPLEKVSFTMTDTDGRPYDFRAETDGHITLLFFGYTYCPDICPIHMATLSSALRELDPDVRERVRVVFVSVDPARDTPERLEQWLAAFDSSFVAVRGTDEEVAEALAFYRYPPPETSGEEVGYTVGHPASIYAFTPDDLGRAMYGVETTKAVWIHDLNLMAGHDWGTGEPGTGDASAAPAEEPAALAVAGDVQILDVYVPRPPAGDVTAVYLSLRNDGTVPDTLVGLSANVAARGTLHDMRHVEGRMVMEPLRGGVALPPGETVTLAPGGRHGMLEELKAELEPGTTVDVILRFSRAGPVAVQARVVRYEDLVR